jgi:perosamine synthetase
MTKITVPVNTPLLIGNEKKYLNECVNSGWIGTDGPFVKKFENKFSKYINRKYGIALSSGTAALDVAFAALNLKKGDEVILPTFTIISCLNYILRVGAIPVFIDSDPETWNMDTNLIESKITKKTKIILAVHIYGLPAEIEKILKIAKKYKLKVIEDSAELIGQRFKKNLCGSFGDISTFSFYTNKHITTGEGGMVLTNDKKLADRCASLRNLFFSSKKRFIHKEIGWNYRMSNLQAAVGLAQLEKIEYFVKVKRNMGRMYLKELSNEKYLDFQKKKIKFSNNIYWVFGIVLKKNCPISLEQLRKKLLIRGIQTRPFFYCLHKQPLLRNYKFKKSSNLNNAENLSKNGFYLPSGLSLSKKKIKFVIKELKKILKKL